MQEPFRTPERGHWHGCCNFARAGNCRLIEGELMRNVRAAAGAALSAWILTGCGTLPGVGEEAGSARLPTGTTLLAAEEEDCAGIIEVGDGVRSRGEAQVAPGQNATFRVADREIEWTCLDRTLPDAATIECPADTEYVRITRGAGGEEALFECFG